MNGMNEKKENVTNLRVHQVNDLLFIIPPIAKKKRINRKNPSLKQTTGKNELLSKINDGHPSLMCE